MGAVTVKHDDELERDYGKWVLVRRSLGVGSFGINTVELPPGDSIPEHDETERGHEELFLVLEGAPTLVADGAEHALRPARSHASSRSRSGRCETTATLSRGCSSCRRP